MFKKKRSSLSGSIAVLLAAVMLIAGGTFAYLKSDTDQVVNKFNSHNVNVTLTEGEGEGLYDIIPGTTQSKTPVVTVDATVPAYVYLQVTDKTNGLVQYEINEGVWTKMPHNTNVYYLTYDPSADNLTNEFHVLDGDRVSYDSALENSDMVAVNEDGTFSLKEGIELSFKAYACQQAGFENSTYNQVYYEAYEVAYNQLFANAENVKEVADAREMTEDELSKILIYQEYDYLYGLNLIAKNQDAYPFLSKYHVDFALSFDQNVDTAQLRLAGRLPDLKFLGKAWIPKNINKGTLKAGESLRVLRDCLGLQENQIISFDELNSFDCAIGVKKGSTELSGKTVKLELRLYETKAIEVSDGSTFNEETGNYTTIATYEKTL